MTTAIDSLDNLLRALHNAVIEAQKLTENQHIRQLRRYFNLPLPDQPQVPDELRGKPEVLTIKVPDPTAAKAGAQGTTGEASYIEMVVPLLALVPPGAVRIKDFRVGFRVRLLGFSEDVAKAKKHSGPLRVDVSGGAPDDGAMAEVNVTFEGTEPPEAFYRIISQLTASSLQ